MPAADEEGIQGCVACLLVESRRVCMIIHHKQNLIKPLHLELLGSLRDVSLLVDNSARIHPSPRSRPVRGLSGPSSPLRCTF